MLAEVKKCADAHDIKGLRYIFVDCLDVDPTFEKYRNDYEFCKLIDGLFDAHQMLNGIKEREEDWTKEYWEQLKLDLMKNFSQIRFEHMIKVAKVVYADKIRRLINERNSVLGTDSPNVSTPIVKNTIAESKPIEEKVKEIQNHETKPEVHSFPPVNAAKAPSNVEIQNRMIEARKRELEEENRRIEAEQAAQQERIAAARRAATNNQSEPSKGWTTLKKVMGIVLLATVIVVVALIITSQH